MSEAAAAAKPSEGGTSKTEAKPTEDKKAASREGKKLEPNTESATAVAQTTKNPTVLSSASPISPKPPKKSLSSRIFKSGKQAKKNSTSTAVDESETPKVVVRNKSFRRIRGFLKGRSKKSLKASADGEDNSETASSRRANLSASVASGGQGEDGSVYNVTLDERSVASSVVGDVSTVVRSEDKYLLRLVLLLMDVNTRRFELLQLEFDSEKAVVADVLTQVPVSVTEEKLRSQKYSGLVTPEGQEMKPDKILRDFCTGNDVLVAVPEGVDPKESTRLAKPILSDRKVVNMLKGSGLDTTKWVKRSSSQEPGEPIAVQKIEEAEEKEEEHEVSTREAPAASSKVKFPALGSSLIFGVIVFALGLFVASMVHKYISTPIKPGQMVPPGIVLSKCGLDFWSGCEPAYLNVQSEEVSYYEGEKTAAWVIRGHSCPEEKLKDKTCVDGLVFKNDLTLWLGGEPIKWLEDYADEDTKKIETAHLTPWPFAEEPKIKARNNAAGRLAGISSHIAEEAKKAASKVINKAITDEAAKKIAESTAEKKNNRRKDEEYGIEL